MSIWSKIIDKVSGNVSAYANEEASRDASHYAIVDCEVGMKDKRVHDMRLSRWYLRFLFAIKRIFCHLCIKNFAKIICNTEYFSKFVLGNHSEIL